MPVLKQTVNDELLCTNEIFFAYPYNMNQQDALFTFNLFQ